MLLHYPASGAWDTYRSTHTPEFRYSPEAHVRVRGLVWSMSADATVDFAPAPVVVFVPPGPLTPLVPTVVEDAVAVTRVLVVTVVPDSDLAAVEVAVEVVAGTAVVVVVVGAAIVVGLGVVVVGIAVVVGVLALLP